jgi:hypothetical protein
MAKPSTNNMEWHPTVKQYYCVAVSKIVQANWWQVGLPNQTPEPFRHPLGIKGIARPIGKHEIVFIIP